MYASIQLHHDQMTWFSSKDNRLGKSPPFQWKENKQQCMCVLAHNWKGSKWILALETEDAASLHGWQATQGMK